MKYNLEEIKYVVRTNQTLICAAKKLGISTPTVKKYIKIFNIDTSHFKYFLRSTKTEDILIENSPFTHTRHLKERLLREGLKLPKCDICGIVDWCDERLSFELHHVNGNYTDNRLENLEILCPNCHSQTDNFGHKNTGNGRPRKPKTKINLI